MFAFYRRKFINIIFIFSLVMSSLFVIVPLFLIIKFVFLKGISSLDLDFFTKMPVAVGEAGGGMLHAIVGTIYLVALAGLLSIPLGVICGVFLSEYGTGKIATALQFSIDMLTGVPSIVIGIIAYTLIVVPLKGFNALAGGVALAIIIVPIVTRSTEEILKLIPDHYREAGLALGLPRWKVIFKIILKSSFPSILTGIMLAISRAAGETAPLLFTSFGNMYLSFGLLGPMASLPVQIYNYAISPYDDWQEKAWGGAFVLIVIVLGINLSARAFTNRKKLWLFIIDRS